MSLFFCFFFYVSSFISFENTSNIFLFFCIYAPILSVLVFYRRGIFIIRLSKIARSIFVETQHNTRDYLATSLFIFATYFRLLLSRAIFARNGEKIISRLSLFCISLVNSLKTDTFPKTSDLSHIQVNTTWKMITRKSVWFFFREMDDPFLSLVCVLGVKWRFIYGYPLLTTNLFRSVVMNFYGRVHAVDTVHWLSV